MLYLFFLRFRNFRNYDVTPQVNTYIEDCISQKDPLIKIMRLVCMQSVCNNGLKQKVLDFYKREILQVQSDICVVSVSFPCLALQPH